MEIDLINDKIKLYVDLGYSIRRIAKEVELSATAVRYRLKLLNLKTCPSPEVCFGRISNKFCTICEAELTGLQTKYCSDKCKSQDPKNKGNSYSSQKLRGASRKRQLIEKLGGQCEVCGYSKNIAALCFHHKISKTKSFGLHAASLSNRSQESIDIEVAKCQLLCQNCHVEIHNPRFSLT